MSHHTHTQGRPLQFVRDVMTPQAKLITVSPDTTVRECLALLVDNHIRGVPVVDADRRPIGLVSDWDLINLSDLSGELEEAKHMFPEHGKSWSAFKEIKLRLEKNAGTHVRDICDHDLTMISPSASLDSAARLLLDKKRRRLPVVDGEGRLVGVISRGDVLKAALLLKKRRKAQMAPKI